MDEIIAACMNYEGSFGDVDDFPISEIPVWILGRKYSTQTELEEIRSDIRSRIWLTYRRNFLQILDTNYTSDKGWGCMLRCGQMVVAEAFLRLHLGRDWRWCPAEQKEAYLKIVSLFEDDEEKPFSLHQISKLGVADGRQVGEWYGPNAVAQVLKKIQHSEDWANLKVHVVMDNIFIKDEIKQSAMDGNSKGFQPLLIFIPVRLGVSEINPVYFESLKKCLTMPHSLGIIGGKPNHALYFVGFMGEEIIYLDPHMTQDSGSVSQKLTDDEKDFDLTYHCSHGQRMPYEYLDPSLALCFLCCSEKDFGDLCNRLQQDVVDTETSPFLEMFQTRPAALMDGDNLSSGFEMDDRDLQSEDEEFEILE